MDKFVFCGCCIFSHFVKVSCVFYGIITYFCVLFHITLLCFNFGVFAFFVVELITNKIPPLFSLCAGGLVLATHLIIQHNVQMYPVSSKLNTSYFD